MNHRRGQSSIEYLTAISFVLLAIAGSLIYVYQDIITNDRLATAGSTMLDIKKSSDNVYASGPGRKETINVRIPTGVIDTKVTGGRIVMKMDLPGGLTTESVEAVDASKIIGRIPKVDGIHQLPIEYTHSGFVVIGGYLILVPDYIEVNTTPGNLTAFNVTVLNVGDEDIPNVNVGVDGDVKAWFAINETLIDLAMGTNKTLKVTVTTPGTAMPHSYPNQIYANATDDYTESIAIVNVIGALCGNTILETGEGCEAQYPYYWPFEDSPDCLNPSPKCNGTEGGYIDYLDNYGNCIDGCGCQNDTGVWKYCNTPACNDPDYCFNSALGCGDSCSDGYWNCWETGVDSGGPCSGTSHDTWFPIEDMENPNVTIIGCSADNPSFDTSTGFSPPQGSHSGNLTFSKEGNCDPTWEFNLDPPLDLSPYSNGVISFKTYGISHPTGTQNEVTIRIGPDSSNYFEYNFGRAKEEIPLGVWETHYITVYPPDSSTGTMIWNNIGYFSITLSNTGNGVLDVLIDDVKITQA